jgi:AraC-like DNA-binding protein
VLLSRNYPPSAALAPYIRRHYVFAAPLPVDFELIDQLLSETAFIRILLEGDWAGETEPGEWRFVGPTPLFGANFQPLRVRVRGPFRVVGVALRPSGWPALFPCSARLLSDRMVALEEHWGELASALHERVSASEDDEAIVAAIEDVVTERLAQVGNGGANAAMARFECIARADSTARIADVAEELGISVRHLERLSYDCFGHSPKAVLRRSRFLDMAQALRGFSAPSEQELASMRYFDQSHRNREFRHFVRMTSKAFESASTPLLTAGLKLRAEGIS